MRPVHPRDAARLLVVKPGAAEAFADKMITDLPSLIAPGDALVFNDTRVIPAALKGVRVRGEATAQISANLIERLDDHRWEALAKPGKRLEPGDRIRFGDGGNACALGSLDATVEAEGAPIVQVNPTELEVSVPFAYITQSVQRQDGDVPLVAGRDGLLRGYLEGGQPNFFEPAVRATFYRDGSEVFAQTVEKQAVGLPQDVEEGERQLTYEARIPGSVLQPGTSLVLEVDPGGVVPATSSSPAASPSIRPNLAVRPDGGSGGSARGGVAARHGRPRADDLRPVHVRVDEVDLLPRHVRVRRVEALLVVLAGRDGEAQRSRRAGGGAGAKPPGVARGAGGGPGRPGSDSRRCSPGQCCPPGRGSA